MHFQFFISICIRLKKLLMNIFQQVFANVNRRNSDLILRKENTDQNQLYLKKSPMKKKKPLPKGKKANLKKKAGSLSKGDQSAKDVKEAIEPVLEANVRTLDSIIDASIRHKIENSKKDDELEEEIENTIETEGSQSNQESNDIQENQSENQEPEKNEKEEKLSLSTAVPEEKTQEIIGNLLKTVQIEKKTTLQTPVKSENIDLTYVTPKNDINSPNLLTPKSSSRLPRKINSIPKNRDYLSMPFPEIYIDDDLSEDEMKQKFISVSEKLYSTQLQLEEANERNKQLEDRVYELEMRLNEIQLNNFQCP